MAFETTIVGGEERSTIASVQELEKFCSLLGVSEADVEAALTRESMTAYGQEFVIRLGVGKAGDGRDASANCDCLGTTAT